MLSPRTTDFQGFPLFCTLQGQWAGDPDPYRNIQHKHQSSDSQTRFVQIAGSCRHGRRTQEMGGGSRRLHTRSWARAEGGRGPSPPSPLSWRLRKVPAASRAPSCSSAGRGAAALHGFRRQDNETDIWQVWEGQLLLLFDMPLGTTSVHSMLGDPFWYALEWISFIAVNILFFSLNYQTISWFNPTVCA